MEKIKILFKSKTLFLVIAIFVLFSVNIAFANFVFFNADTGRATFSNIVEVPGLFSSGNVGIGTTSPGARLHVGGSIIVENPGHRAYILHNWGGNFHIAPRNDAGTDWLWDRLVVTSGGNVGIGTTAPNAPLTVGVPTTNANIINLIGGPDTNDGFIAIGRHHAIGNLFIQSQVRFGNEVAGVGQGFLAFATGGSIATERVRITSAGNVGIGTTAPTGILHVRGGRTYIDSNNFGGTPVIDLAVGDNDTGLDSIGDGQLDLWSNNIRTMSIRTGNVGIGTTAPGARLEVFGTPGTQRITTIPSGTTGTYTLSWDAFQICQFGTCAPPWRDLDADGRTYGARTDCNEGCPTCFLGSTVSTPSPDGRDQNCNGVVDETDSPIIHITLNAMTGLNCRDVCVNVYGSGAVCLSIGTDGGSAMNSFYSDWGAHAACMEFSGTCDMPMHSDGGWCGGNTQWTNCRCQLPASVYR